MFPGLGLYSGTIGQVAPPVSDHQWMQNWLKPLTLGVNIERDNLNFITPALVDQLLSCGITHARLFPYTNATFGFKSRSQMAGFYDAVAYLISRGLKVLLDLQDVCSLQEIANAGTQPFITQCVQDIAARNFNPDYFAVGYANETAAGSNAEWNPYNTLYLSIMRAYLPGYPLLCGGAQWHGVDAMVDGTHTIYTDKRILYQWHSYEGSATTSSAWAYRHNQLSNWATANEVTTINGEYSLYAPTPDENTYSQYPSIIDAFAKGAGPQRGTMWTITNGSYFRINISGTNGMLRPEIVTAFTAATAYIRAQPYYSA